MIATEEGSRADAPPTADHWEQIRCDRNKRIVDINHHRREIRWFCDRCRKTHTAKVG